MKDLKAKPEFCPAPTEQSTETENAPIVPQLQLTQLFRAVAEGNMHCYCLLQFVDESPLFQDFIVLYANQKLLRLLQADKTDIVGNRLSRVYPFSKNWIQCRRYFETIAAQQPMMEEFPLEIFEETRWYRHEIVPLSQKILSVTAEDITQSKRLQKQLVKAAYVDELTGLNNRNALMQQLKSKQCVDNGLCILLLDITDFSSLNSCYGYLNGNQLLISLARALEEISEASCFRIAADIFALVIIRKPDQAPINKILVQKILDGLPKHFRIDDKQIGYQLKAGFATSDNANQKHFEELFIEAEIALSEARKSALETVIEYSGEVKQQYQLRLAIAKELPKAVSQKQLLPYLQAQYNLADSELAGFELLCRWQHADLGQLSPDFFIAIAEQLNQLAELDLQLLSQAIQSASVLKPYCREVNLSVNASPKNVESTSYIERLIELSDSLPDWCDLEVEITENALAADRHRLRESMFRLQRQNISIALDDFGSGYSNLTYLASFPFNKIKLDRSLLIEVLDSPRNKDLVTGAIDLSHRLGLKVVAEGIENSAQLNWLRSVGCDIGQGYLLCKPQPMKECQRLLKQGYAVFK